MASNHYVNNKKFCEELIKYRERVQKAKEEGKPEPVIPDYIGLCFMQIATRLSTNGNFSGYSYRDDMVSDGIENCVIAIHNFDPEKSKNPFAYFTQIIWFAFLRRIAKEKKQTYVKYKAFQHMNVMGELFDGEDVGITTNVDNEFMDEIVNSFEETKRKKDAKYKASKRKKQGLEEFIEDDAIPYEDRKTLGLQQMSYDGTEGRKVRGRKRGNGSGHR